MKGRLGGKLKIHIYLSPYETLDFPPETILWQLQKTQLRSVPFSWVVTKDLPTMEKHVQLFPSDSMVEVFSHLFVA